VPLVVAEEVEWGWHHLVHLYERQHRELFIKLARVFK
jgi:hypothetical protein